MPNSWFCYTGTVPSSPSSYTQVSNVADCHCGGTASLCAIYGQVNVASQPIMTSTLIAAVNRAVAHFPSSVALNKGSI